MTALSLLLSAVLAAMALGQPADETRPDGNGAEGEALDLDAMRAEDPDGFADLAMGAMLDTVLFGETERVEVVAERFPEAHEAWALSMEGRVRRLTAEYCERGAWQMMGMGAVVAPELPVDQRSRLRVHLGFAEVSHSVWQAAPGTLRLTEVEHALEGAGGIEFLKYRRNRTAALRAAAESERRELRWNDAAVRAFPHADIVGELAPKPRPAAAGGLDLDRLRADLETARAAARNAWRQVAAAETAWEDGLARADAVARSVWNKALAAGQLTQEFDMHFWETVWIGQVQVEGGECVTPMELVRPSLKAAHFQAAMMSKFTAFALEIPRVTDDESAALYGQYRRSLAKWKEARLAASDLAVAVDEAEVARALLCRIYPDRCDDRPQPPTTGELPGREGRRETGRENHP